MKTTDKKNKKAQPELLRVLDQHLLRVAKEKEDGRIANEEQTKRYGRRYGTITHVRTIKV